MELKPVYYIDKPVGMTPLQMTKLLRKKYPQIKKCSYYGKLDPLAHGLSQVLVNDECKKQEKYENLEKTYRTQVLFGVTTDTNDPMGMITAIENVPELNLSKSKIEAVCKEFEGNSVQPFHRYSSIMVRKGDDYQPLWWWTKNGRIDEITIPTKPIHIYSIKLLSDPVDLRSSEMIPKLIAKVKTVSESAGDFRQNDICKCWESNNSAQQSYNWKMIELECHVSTGTYIRQLVDDISKKLGTVGIAYDIYRTNVGSKEVTDADVLQL